jgi:hypothetical protein
MEKTERKESIWGKDDKGRMKEEKEYRNRN